MTLQTAGTAFSPYDSYTNIRSLGFSIKAQAQNALASAQAGNIDSNFVFAMLDRLNNFITSFTAWKAIAGLDTFATAQNYTGSMVSDCNACITAAQAIISWVVSNFPVDTAGPLGTGFLQALKLNADGSRTASTFTPAQTSGLQSALQSFIATIN